MGDETPYLKALKHCVMRGPPTLFESDFIAFSCFKMADCLSEEELEIAISLNGTSFVAALAVVKYVFTLKHILYFLLY